MALTFRRSTTLAEPRFELAPLLDVIFLLLTFFLYSQVLLIKVDILPINLPSFSGATAVEQADVLAITVDATGQPFVNREPVTEQALADQLKAAANQSPQPRVYLAVDAKMGQVDRAPIMMRIMNMIDQAGVRDVAFVSRWSAAPNEAGN
jgi:biopolymer transport protein ExbD